MKRTIEDLRRSMDPADERQIRMMAAIDAVARIVGDSHELIMATLFGAHVTLASATGEGEVHMRMLAEAVEKARLVFAAGTN